jgi:hypothetical protein
MELFELVKRICSFMVDLDFSLYILYIVSRVVYFIILRCPFIFAALIIGMAIDSSQCGRVHLNAEHWNVYYIIYAEGFGINEKGVEFVGFESH